MTWPPLSNEEILAIAARRTTETFPCGHPRISENIQSVGSANGARCRICRRAISIRSAAKQRKATR